MDNILTVPIHLKMTLTRQRSGRIQQHRHQQDRQHAEKPPNCPFVLFIGTKKLVKRKEF